MNPTIRRLNGYLADNAGRTPHGEPMFKWIASRDLLRAEQTGIDTYEWIPQIDGDCWVLAKWVAPPDRDQWDAMFHGALPWPQRGEYVATDVALRGGMEPTEWLTGELLGMIRAARALNYRGHLRRFMEQRERSERDRRRRISDCIDDAITAFKNPYPGKRGGFISFGGVGDHANA